MPRSGSRFVHMNFSSCLIFFGMLKQKINQCKNFTDNSFQQVKIYGSYVFSIFCVKSLYGEDTGIEGIGLFSSHVLRYLSRFFQLGLGFLVTS